MYPEIFPGKEEDFTMYYIGIDLGGTNIAAGIVDSQYRIVKKGSTPTMPERSAEEIVKDMAALCKQLISEADLTVKDVAYIGIATPGVANRDDGVVEYCCNLPFRNFPIAEVLKKYIDIDKVLIENDANAAAKGEAVAGAAKGYANSVMITLGTGVGGGIIIDHKVYSGFNYAGAELGRVYLPKNLSVPFLFHIETSEICLQFQRTFRVYSDSFPEAGEFWHPPGHKNGS